MGKKDKRKNKIPQGTPLENYETAEMNLKELKKYAVKLGAVLDETRDERAELEVDRDKVLRYLVNVVCRTMIIDREIRQLDREMINEENINERKMAQKVNELAEVRFRQTPQFYQYKNDSFVNSYDWMKELFKKQDQMFVCRIGLNSDYYKKSLELEGTFMAAKHESLCDKMDKVNERNIAQMLWTERKHYQEQSILEEAKYQEYAKEMKAIVNKKEAIIEKIQREHVFECVDIRRSFEDINKYNFTMIDDLSKELSKCRCSTRNFTRQSKFLRRRYEELCGLIKEVKKEILTIEPVIGNLDKAKAVAKKHADELGTLEDDVTTSSLEADLIASYIEEDEGCTEKLKQLVINDLLALRQMQVKAHLFFLSLGETLREMIVGRVKMGKLALHPVELDMKKFQDVLDRYSCYRRSMIDLIERTLRSNFTNLSALGFPPEEPVRLPKLAAPSEESVASDLPRRPSGVFPVLPSVFQFPSHKEPPPKRYEVLKSLPYVPLRTSGEHLRPLIQVKRAHVYVSNVKMSV